MNKWIFIFVLVLLAGCKEKSQETYFTPEKAAKCFKDIEDACKRDGGNLWGKNLYGPLIFIDRTSRKIISNQQDNDGLLKLKDGIYTGLYPRERIITTTSVTFGGTLFGMAPLPIEEDNYRTMTRGIHALFHSFQQTEGVYPENFNNIIMDEKDARLWIKLEWKALKKAIGSQGEEQTLAVRDALIFRGSNHESYPKYAEQGTRFETYEGLATFTFTLLTSESPADYRKRLFENLDRISSFQSYARSYGSIHGALYATLLYYKGFDFKTIKSDTVDLGNLVRKLYNIELPVNCRDVAGSIALHYNVEEINQEEEKRLQEIRERLNNQVSVFTEKPVVLLELESPYFDFEPENVHFLDTLGTLYNTLRVSDNWGKLTVDKGDCLVSNNYKFLRITAKGLKTDKNHINGEGWQIILNDGWEIRESGHNYYIRKPMP
ncbi:MAG TPA: hypothetical protein DEO60_06255 [Bacteroidales bacterium]|jgi:hypothetical protein|nr:hypothetical protein [Bacteroidales bacterium]HBZ20710.1 hypothetical protein [Bacteroidales bacterium]